MNFLAIVVVFFVLQYWGTAEAFHRDHWFRRWREQVGGWTATAGLRVVLLIFVPVLVLWLLLGAIERWSGLLYFLVSIPLLLYSLGRGDYTAWVDGYCNAFHRNDNEVASEYASRMGVELAEVDNWPSLHRGVLRKAAYLGFERWFTAIFWFLLLGPAGAVMYRLAALVVRAPADDESHNLLQRLCWLLEWPVVRLLGLSLALTGSFAGAIRRWQESLGSLELSTEAVLEQTVHGALSANSTAVRQENISEQEVEALVPLLARSLILWLCVLALVALF